MNEDHPAHDIQGFLRRLNGESPRGRVLLQAGLLESLLREAILKRLVDNKSAKDLFGEKSSLGLAVLAKYSHALGLIGDIEVAALKSFADARNKIAHSWHADFIDNDIQKIVSSIQLINVLGDGDMSTHQSTFHRLDYLGVYLIEELSKRFSKMAPTSFDGGFFLSSLVVDPATGSRTKKVTS